MNKRINNLRNTRQVNNSTEALPRLDMSKERNEKTAESKTRMRNLIIPKLNAEKLREIQN